MSREVPRAVKDQAFRLWLQGESYRNISARTGMSLGAISELINGLRGKAPDLDSLRELSMVLGRAGSDIHDAIRGGRLMEELNRLGVGLEQLEGYLRLSERMASGRGVEAERLIDSAMRLADLEAMTGRPYGEVIKELEASLKRLEELNREVELIRRDRDALLGEVEAQRGKLRGMIEAEERLKRIGLERVAALAEYAERLGELEARMVREGRRSEAETRRAEALRAEVRRLRAEKDSLLASLPGLRLIAEKGKIIMPCKLCGAQGILMSLPRRVDATRVALKGLSWSFQCTICGGWAQYTPWDITSSIGWLTLPE